jgi:hypothetical protein
MGNENFKRCAIFVKVQSHTSFPIFIYIHMHLMCSKTFHYQGLDIKAQLVYFYLISYLISLNRYFTVAYQ